MSQRDSTERVNSPPAQYPRDDSESSTSTSTSDTESNANLSSELIPRKSEFFETIIRDGEYIVIFPANSRAKISATFFSIICLMAIIGISFFFNFMSDPDPVSYTSSSKSYSDDTSEFESDSIFIILFGLLWITVAIGMLIGAQTAFCHQVLKINAQRISYSNSLLYYATDSIEAKGIGIPIKNCEFNTSDLSDIEIDKKTRISRNTRRHIRRHTRIKYITLKLIHRNGELPISVGDISSKDAKYLKRDILNFFSHYQINTNIRNI